MLLGDVIARFEDEAVVSETLFALDDLALMARIATLAAENSVSAGEFAMQSIGRFVNGASDEEWLTLLGQNGARRGSGPSFSATRAVERVAAVEGVSIWMAVAAIKTSQSLITWHYLWWAQPWPR
jgi:hypothetical protein